MELKHCSIHQKRDSCTALEVQLLNVTLSPYLHFLKCRIRSIWNQKLRRAIHCCQYYPEEAIADSLFHVMFQFILRPIYIGRKKIVKDAQTVYVYIYTQKDKDDGLHFKYITCKQCYLLSLLLLEINCSKCNHGCLEEAIFHPNKHFLCIMQEGIQFDSQIA